MPLLRGLGDRRRAREAQARRRTCFLDSRQQWNGQDSERFGANARVVIKLGYASEDVNSESARSPLGGKRRKRSDALRPATRREHPLISRPRSAHTRARPSAVLWPDGGRGHQPNRRSVTELLARPLSPSSVRRVFTILDQLLDSAVDTGVIAVNPAADTPSANQLRRDALSH